MSIDAGDREVTMQLVNGERYTRPQSGDFRESIASQLVGDGL